MVDFYFQIPRKYATPATEKKQAAERDSAEKIEDKKVRKSLDMNNVDLPVTDSGDSLPPPGEYTVDTDKFDDPNFDPFVSNKAMRNSPTGIQ